MAVRDYKETRALMEQDPVRAERMAHQRAQALAEYEAYERRLPDLRKACALTQQDTARKLAVSQAQVSRIENQADMYLSSLAQYIAALGGS